MKTSEVIEFYGSQTAVGEALGIYQSSVAEWGEEPPDLRQIQLESLSGHKLKANPKCYGPAAPAPQKRRVAA